MQRVIMTSTVFAMSHSRCSILTTWIASLLFKLPYHMKWNKNIFIFVRLLNTKNTLLIFILPQWGHNRDALYEFCMEMLYTTSVNIFQLLGQ